MLRNAGDATIFDPAEAGEQPARLFSPAVPGPRPSSELPIVPVSSWTHIADRAAPGGRLPELRWRPSRLT